MAKAKKKAKKASAKKSTTKKTTAKKASAKKKSVAKKVSTKKKVAKAKPTKKAKVTKAKSATKKAEKKTKVKVGAKKTATKKAAAPKKATAPKATSAPKKNLPKIDVSKIFRPLENRVLFRREGFSDKTPGGLFIPETVSDSDRPSRGTVLAVGPGFRDKKGRLRPLDVKAGDEVMFFPYAGSEVTIDGAEYLILREDDIIAVTN